MRLGVYLDATGNLVSGVSTEARMIRLLSCLTRFNIYIIHSLGAILFYLFFSFRLLTKHVLFRVANVFYSMRHH